MTETVQTCRCGKPFASVEPAVLCPECEAASLPTAEITERAADATLRQTLRGTVPRLRVTPALLLTMVAVFGTMVATGVSPWNPASEDIMRWGGNYGPAAMTGEVWRTLTTLFVHVGIVHLLLNSWVLWDLGSLAERLFGHVHFLGIYVLSGIGGSLMSTWWETERLSAGASGAIFGIAGALAVTLYLKKLPLPAAVVKKNARGMRVYIVYALAFGMLGHIDNAAHVGGLLTGAVIALLLPVRFPIPVIADASGVHSSRSAVPAFAVAITLLCGFASYLYAANGHVVAIHKAESLLAQQRAPEAIALLDEASLKDSGNPRLHFLLGSAHYILENYDRAIAEFREAARDRTYEPSARANLGLTYLQTGQIEQARESLRMSLHLQDDSADVNAWLADAYFRLGERAKAEEYVHKALRLDGRCEYALRLLDSIKDERTEDPSP